MKRIIRSLSCTTVVLGIAAVAAAQTPVLLSTIEVRQLVARGDAADNSRLSAHFTAVADRYEAEAKRHVAMASNVAGNPSRGFGSGISAHCKTLAKLNAESASTVRELAAYHAKLVAGQSAPPPAGASSFQAGAGAAQPQGEEVAALAGKASSPAEHKAIAAYFAGLAKRYTADAAEHAALAQAYRGTRLAQAAVHHDALARFSRDGARAAAAAAAVHER